MSGNEYMFGVLHRAVTPEVARRLDAICKEQGGTGFTGPVDMPGSTVKGWFTARNQGEPFDSALARAVAVVIDREGIEL